MDSSMLLENPLNKLPMQLFFGVLAAHTQLQRERREEGKGGRRGGGTEMEMEDAAF